MPGLLSHERTRGHPDAGLQLRQRHGLRSAFQQNEVTVPVLIRPEKITLERSRATAGRRAPSGNRRRSAIRPPAKEFLQTGEGHMRASCPSPGPCPGSQGDPHRTASSKATEPRPETRRRRPLRPTAGRLLPRRGVPVGKTNSGAGIRCANLPAQIFLLHQHADGLKERLLRTEGKHPAGNDGLFMCSPPCSGIAVPARRTGRRTEPRTSAMYRAINSPTLPAAYGQIRHAGEIISDVGSQQGCLQEIHDNPETFHPCPQALPEPRRRSPSGWFAESGTRTTGQRHVPGNHDDEEHGIHRISARKRLRRTPLEWLPDAPQIHGSHHQAQGQHKPGT